MIWRALVFFDVLTVGNYIWRDHGEAAAWPNKKPCCPRFSRGT